MTLEDLMLQDLMIRVLPGDPPIRVESVTELDRDGEPCWLIEGHWHRVPLHGGSCVQRERYVVPMACAHMVERVA